MEKGWHFILCMCELPLYVCSVAQLCLTLCDPRDCSLPPSSVHEIFQARILGWAAISSSRGSGLPFSSVQSLSHFWLFATPWTAARQAYLSFTISWSLLKLMSVELMMTSNHLILCHPLILLSIFPSIRFFSNESVLCIRWPKYWSFSISPSKEYSGLISFRIDWFYLLAV